MDNYLLQEGKPSTNITPSKGDVELLNRIKEKERTLNKEGKLVRVDFSTGYFLTTNPERIKAYIRKNNIE